MQHPTLRLTMSNLKSAIEIVNEVLAMQELEMVDTIKNLKYARENNGHLKITCFWPETFICVSKNGNEFELCNTPTLFNLHDALNVTHSIRNGHGQHPIMKTQISFYEMKLEWLSTQIENTQSLLN